MSVQLMFKRKLLKVPRNENLIGKFRQYILVYISKILCSRCCRFMQSIRNWNIIRNIFFYSITFLMLSSRNFRYFIISNRIQKLREIVRFNGIALYSATITANTYQCYNFCITWIIFYYQTQVCEGLMIMIPVTFEKIFAQQSSIPEFAYILRLSSITKCATVH